MIGTIAGISYFLRQAVIDNSVSKKKRRKRSYSLANLILAGKLKKKNHTVRLKFEKRATGSSRLEEDEFALKSCKSKASLFQEKR